MTINVLIVEDNDMNMRLFNDLLQAHGYSTIQAKTAEEGLVLCQKNKPDLVLMDINLPGRDGLSLTQEIKTMEDLRHIPIIALTAYAMKGDRERFLEGGFDGYMAKPIEIDTFLNTIETTLKA